MALGTNGIRHIWAFPRVCDQACRRFGKTQIFAARKKAYLAVLNRVFTATKMAGLATNPQCDQLRRRKCNAFGSPPARHGVADTRSAFAVCPKLPSILATNTGISQTSRVLLRCDVSLGAPFTEGDPNGTRTRVAGVKGRSPRPLDDGATRLASANRNAILNKSRKRKSSRKR